MYSIGWRIVVASLILLVKLYRKGKSYTRASDGVYAGFEATFPVGLQRMLPTNNRKGNCDFAAQVG
jgi:hypothetical protein